MKALTYHHNWSTNMTADEEMAAEFGTLLHEVDTSEGYDTELARLHKSPDGRFNLLEANGCSCWDGDYDGWSFTKTELLKWAKQKSGKQEYEWRRQAHELVADWVMEHKDEL
jgi:hypothetical protein